MMSPDLSDRQREIVLLAAEGHTDKEIAQRLGVGRGTVTTHWKRLRERTGAVNRAQAIAFEMARVYRESEAERMRTADLYQCLIENREEFAVFLMDKNLKAISWNPGVGQILGYSEADWIGRTGSVIFTPEDRAEGEPQREKETALREGRALDDRWHVRQDGSRFWASGALIAIRNREGELLCFSKILRDLSRLKRLESQVESLGENPTR